MRSRVRGVLAASLLSVVLASSARAQIAPGANAPDFTKSVLGGGSVSRSQYDGQVLVLFLLGYDCPFCRNDAPSVEADLAQYYAQRNPGQVQVLGIDLWNGTAGQLAAFRSATGVTFPLLLNGATATGGNVQNLYGTYDNYVVVNKRGVVRYHAALTWPHGNRYHLDELRAAVDSLVTNTAGAGAPASAPLALAAMPNPMHGATDVSFRLPAAERAVDLSVFDATGRRLATLWAGPAAAGDTHVRWNGRDDRGEPVAPGVVFVRGTFGARVLVRRLAVLR